MNWLGLTTILAAEMALVFLLFLITSTRKRGRSHYILAAFMGAEAVHFLVEWCYYNYADTIFVYCSYLMYGNALLIIPLFTAYVRSITGNNVLSYSLKISGFTAIVVFIAYAVLFTQMPGVEKVEYARYTYGELFSPGLQRFPLSYLGVFTLCIAFPLQIVCFGAESIRLLARHKKRIDEMFSFTENISLNWLVTIISVFFLLIVLGAGMTLSGSRFAEIIYYAAAIPMTFTIGFMGVKQKEIFVTNSAATLPASAEGSPATVKPTPQSNVEAANDSSPTDPDAKADIPQQLERLFSLDGEERLFRTPDLTINDVARIIGSNKSYTSEVINTVYKKNFRAYVNHFRIEEAKRLLSSNDRKYSTMSIDDILVEAGFQSSSTFFKLFKEAVGATPDEYRKKCCKVDSTAGKLDALAKQALSDFSAGKCTKI